jgi:hypothetical protein
MKSPYRSIPIRFAVLALILAVLFIGGLIVSVKIGGGSNLHNMDAFLVMLWLVGSYSFFEIITLHRDYLPWKITAYRLAWAALLIPAILTLSISASEHVSKTVEDQVDLQSLRELLSDADREVLFLSQPQLITFGEVKGKNLTPRYENLFLMEMAMSYNYEYLDHFHFELAQHKFAYIVTNPLFIVYKGRDAPFGEENDIWVQQVSEKVLCYYEPILLLKRVRVEVLSPRVHDCIPSSH